MDKIKKIEELLEQINPLNQKRTFLETKLHFHENNFLTSFDKAKKMEILNDRKELKLLYKKLNPLFHELRELQCLYEIVFQGELINPRNGEHYWNTPEKKRLYLKTCCDIDTIENGWGRFIDDDCVNHLIMEVHDFLYRYCYSNFKIWNIKRI